jgi:hypothetical protein
LNLEVDLLFFDTTSTYFETPTADQPADGATVGFRTWGKSKDHRNDLPQIVIGMAVTRTGIPIRVWSWSGNTGDQPLIRQVKDDLADWRLGHVIWVADRGFSSLRTAATSNAPAGTTSSARRSGGTPKPPQHWPDRAATTRSATTCGSKKSESMTVLHGTGS